MRWTLSVSYLFGPSDRGQAGENSDLDLLIVERREFGPERSRRREMAQLWRALAHFRVPKDTLLYTQDEVIRLQDARNHVISRAFRKGGLL